MDCILIIGKKCRGKTILINALLPHLHCEHTVIYNPTEPVKKEYSDITAPENIHHEYTEQSLNAFVQTRKELAKANKSGCVVFEDCIHDNSFWKQKPLKALFLNGRCMKTHVLMVIQYPLSIPPIFRCNIDYVFIFGDNQIISRKRIYDQYACMFPTFEDFNKVFEQLTTEPYTCMVINNTAKSNKIDDQVMWYKAVKEIPLREMVDTPMPTRNGMHGNDAEIMKSP